MYNPFNPVPNTPVQPNPHSPANKQQPVNVPGVLGQTNQLLKPYQPKDSK